MDAEQTAKLNKYFNSTGGVRLDNIEDNVFNSMVGIGINPAGPKPSVNYNQCAGSWYELFDFNEGKAKSDLGDAKTEFIEIFVLPIGMNSWPACLRTKTSHSRT